MPTYYRYAEDFTGENPDNLVAGEIITLSDRPIRVGVPKYAPFFSKSLVIIDNATQRLLVNGVDYKIPIISQEASLRAGEEIADAFLIENPEVSSEIQVTYQCLGGLHQSNIENIAKIYESYMNDNRSVDWNTGVFGKPDEYKPSMHPHFLRDIFGFEPITFELERIAQAITLGNTPAFEMFLDAIETRFATITDMDMGKPLNRAVTLAGLLHVLDKYNFNSIVLSPDKLTLTDGQLLWVDVTASNVPGDARYFWTIQNESTQNSDFTALSGVVDLKYGKAKFSVQLFKDDAAEPVEYFRVLLRRNGPDGQIVAKTRRLMIRAHRMAGQTRILDVLKVPCTLDPRIQHKAKTTAIRRSIRNAAHS